MSDDPMPPTASVKLPPAPRDAWGRFHAERGSFGALLWVRPRELAELHPTILHLDARAAVDELTTWMRQPWGGPDFLRGLHHQAFGPPWTMDAGEAWEQILRDLEDALGSGWLVIHSERPTAIAPGAVPVPPGRSPRPPALPTPALTWVEIALVDDDGQPIANEPVRVVTPEGRAIRATTDELGLVRFEGIVAGVCDVTFPRIDAREWKRR